MGSRLLQGCKVARSQLLHDRKGYRGPVCRPFITSTTPSRAVAKTQGWTQGAVAAM